MKDNQSSISEFVNPVYPIKAERLGSLRRSGLFSGISEHECAHIASAARKRTFARHERLFMQ
jgi:hypothetical protein